MPEILTTLSTIMCPHGGTVSLSTSNSTCQISGGFALLQTDQHTVSGCPFQKPAGPTTVPSPCLTVVWTTGATQTKVSQTAVLLKNSSGMCFSGDQIPQGAPKVSQVQTDALGQ